MSSSVDMHVDHRLVHRAFSKTYIEAQSRFRELATRNGGLLTEIPHPLIGCNGEPLAIDVASWGSDNPESTLLLSSGLHGVEGFFGSAVQVALLESGLLPDRLERMRLVLVHALNPWGFSCGRRFDHNNIDCNRNFLLPGADYSGSPELYRELDSFLNPKRRPHLVDSFFVEAFWLIRRFGFAPLQQAIASGQFDFPEGLFFAGQGPSWTQHQFAAHWEEWTAEAARVVHFDFHTGLGRSGQGRLLLDYQPTEAEQEWFERMFEPQEISFVETESSSNQASEDQAESAKQTRYHATGGIGTFCHQQYPNGSYAYACCEFGTLHPVRMLRRLRQENQGYFHDRLGSNRRARAHRRLHNAFCPNSPRWRRKTLNTALDWITRSLEDLEQSP